jgi:hypothetical protein
MLGDMTSHMEDVSESRWSQPPGIVSPLFTAWIDTPDFRRIGVLTPSALSGGPQGETEILAQTAQMRNHAHPVRETLRAAAVT